MDIVKFATKIDSDAVLKISGMILGGALGDTLGAPFEFEHRCKYTGVLDAPTEILTENGWKLRGVPGQCTDDTEMAIALWNSIIENGGIYDEKIAVKHYIDWVNNNTGLYRDIGTNTRTLFAGKHSYNDYLKAYKFNFSGSPSNWTQSNGALMRSGALAFLKYIGQPPTTDCELTNPHRNTIVANLAFVGAVSDALGGMTKRQIFTRAAALSKKSPDVFAIFAKVAKRADMDVGKSVGWVLNALYCAFYALMHFVNYKTGIDWIIKQGGDTDTNACIGGYLLGAFYGLNGMIRSKITSKNLNIMLGARIPARLAPLPRYKMGWRTFLRIINFCRSF